MIHASADVDASASIPDSCKVWHLAQVREGAVLGEDVTVGRGAYVGSRVHVGAATKIQNYALVYEPAVIGAGVFIGPHVVLTNDRNPRAAAPDLRPLGPADWTHVGVTIHDGASLGAGTVVVAPCTIGSWALIAAGSTVTRDVPAFALMAGAPARQVGWVSRAGHRLVQHGDRWRCPVSGELYELTHGHMAVAS